MAKGFLQLEGNAARLNAAGCKRLPLYTDYTRLYWPL